jgi:hypothetical protein
VVEAPLANVCDTNYTSLAKVAKQWLPGAAARAAAGGAGTTTRGMHEHLREVARAYLGS